MAKIITLEDLGSLGKQENDWAYNALDCVGTRQIADVLLPRLDDLTGRTYAFERAFQNPAVTMMRRGVKVDVVKRAEETNALTIAMAAQIRTVNKDPLIKGVWDKMEKVTGLCRKNPKKGGHHKWPRGEADTIERKCEHCGTPRLKVRPFNPNSSDDTSRLFYTIYKVPFFRNKTGEISTDDDVLDRIARRYPKYALLIHGIRDVRDKKKQLGFLKFKLGPDNRFYVSVNVGAAWTGRLSSSKNPFGYGGNGQNISEQHRRIFLADAGCTMFYSDLEQAESNAVAHLAQDPDYIEAHKSGDVHTFVTRMLWPFLLWTGDLKKDKAIAKQLPPWDPVPGHDWRFQAKRCQHGCNYGLTPNGISMIAHIPLVEARKMYHAYHEQFPFIREWQNGIRKMVEEQTPLVNPLGRKIRLFGRPWDEHTYKQGLSFIPQSTVADIINIAIWRLWKAHDPHLVQLQLQVHDAILGQFRTGDRDAALPAIKTAMTIPVPINGRVMTIGVEHAIGRNWGKKTETNPLGLEAV